ncbi:MAG TPA: SDR family oxidoreductase [Pirellulaceae bacterium]|nr:SDR family oxidoreductase [Pirellulaceae bacterium]
MTARPLSGKIALVTGAGRGIGRAIARAFAGEGATLVLAGRTAAHLEEAAAEARSLSGQPAVVQPADVADEAQVDELFRRLKSEFGRLDLLANNAGAFDGGPLDELSVEAWDKVINTNLRAPFLCTRAALRIMKPQKSGRIINIGSISAQRVRPNSGPYSASKHGLWGLTQVTALEGREFGISCCCLHPGNVMVERRVESGKLEDDEPMMSADEIAKVALLMATLPRHVEMLEAIVLPHQQLYVGRG